MATVSTSNSEKCDRILLYASDLVASDTGLGHRTAYYILASVLAALTDSALVILEPPPNGQWANVGGSPFGCPLANVGEEECGNLFPTGMSRILQVPQRLSRGCDVPCTHSHSYDDWFKIAMGTNEKSSYASTVCTADDDEGEDGLKKNVTVLAIGKYKMNNFFYERLHPKFYRRHDKEREQWVRNLSTSMGASHSEIDYFLRKNNVTTPARNIFQYLRALISRTGIHFQPWVVQDVKKSIEKFDKLPLRPSSDETSLQLFKTSSLTSGGYDAMHIRRGDRIYSIGSMMAVEKYWVERGYPAVNITTRSMKKWDSLSALYPTNYIPFSQYWDRYKKSRCSNSGLNNKTHASSAHITRQGAIRYLYLATDDIVNVRAEIANLTLSEGAKYWTRCEQQIEFVYNPQEQYAKHIHVQRQSIRQQEDCENCEEGYEMYMRTLCAITDLHILSQSDIFVGESKSYWGKMLRTFRTSFEHNIPMTKDTWAAWGDPHMELLLW